jgi:hypothetical protein
MKWLILAGALVLASANLAPVLAQGLKASGGGFPAQADNPASSVTSPQHEWQYGSIGHRPLLGDWRGSRWRSILRRDD